MHFSRCTYPQVLSTISPLCSIYTSTDGSDLLSFFNPYNIFGLSSKLGVVTLTFRIDLVWDVNGINEIQSYTVDRVADLNTWFYKQPMPTTFPA